MHLCHQSDWIEVRRTDNRGKGGRGVFARRDIPAGTLIERVPVLLIPKGEVFGESELAKQAGLISWYVFNWNGAKKKYVALALGYGSIYNHSYEPNTRYVMDPPDVMEYEAIADIAAGEELFINYAGDGVIKDLGFEVE